MSDAPTPTPVKTGWSTRTWLILAGAWLVSMLVTAGGPALVVWWILHTKTPQPDPPMPPPVIGLPASVKAPVGVLTKVPVECAGLWKHWTNICACSDVEPVGNEIWIVPHKAGQFDLIAWTCKSGPSDAAVCVLTAGDPVPPVPPVPPIPPVPPVPPPPPPDPAPIPTAGFRVLVVWKESERGNMPAAQRDILYSDQVRSYLSQKCAKGPDGKQPEYRFFPDNEDLTNESQLWKDAFKVKADVLPRIIVSNGKTGYVGPLPANVDEAMKLFSKYAE